MQQGWVKWAVIGIFVLILAVALWTAIHYWAIDQTAAWTSVAIAVLVVAALVVYWQKVLSKGSAG